MIYKSSSEWSALKKRAVIAYVLVNFLFISAFISTIVVASYFGVDLDIVQNAHAFFVAGMYLFLSASLAVFGWRLVYLVSVKNVKIPFLKSKLQIAILTMTLLFVFGSRAVKDFLSGFGKATFNLSDPSMQPITTQAILFSMYLFWEIIPATLVLIFFWHIPGSNKEPAPAVPVPYYNAVNFNINSESIESVPFIDSPTVAAKVKATNQLFSSPGGTMSGDELTSPLGRILNKESHGSPFKKSSRPNFKQYSGYDTRSPLIEDKTLSLLNNKEDV